jgi:choline dehydrogenase-like flavoprotein
MQPAGDLITDTDVCVIGSGMAGAIVAMECLEAGRSVVMLEAGRPANGRALGLQLIERAVRDYRTPRMRLWHRRAMYRPDDYISKGYGLKGKALMIRGGSTLGWSGDAYRMRPEDFRLATETGRGIDWPIDYEDLKPFYSKAERTIRVSGDYCDVGHPQRDEPFPNDPEPYARRDQPFLDVLSRHDWAPMHHNVSRAPAGSVFTGDELVDQIERHRQFTLMTQTVAVRLVPGSKDRVAAVECRDTTTEASFLLNAEIVVVCAGGIETPNLLLNSRHTWWPDGLGNEYDHVGRHLVSHGGVALGGRPRGVRWRNGPIAPTAASRQFDTHDEQSAGKYLLVFRPAPSGLVFFNAIFEHFPSEANSVRPGSETNRWGLKKPKIVLERDEGWWRRAAELRSRFVSFAQESGMKPTKERTYLLAHPMSTARMSSTPRDGVVDADMRIHSVGNAYVCGSAVFSSAGAANPTMTIAALAHKLGDHLASLP